MESENKHVEAKKVESSGTSDYRLLKGCVASALGAVVVAFVVVKIGLNYYEGKLQSVVASYETVENKVRSVLESVSDLNASIENMKTDWKNERENASYLLTSLSAIQKDISVIRDKLNIEDTVAPDDPNLTKLSSEKRTFIETLENLVHDGAPFAGFLENYDEKLELKKFQTFDPLSKLASENVRSRADLKKDFAAVGFSLFSIELEDSFWEKQKRIIKEKISDAIRIRKTDDNGVPVEESPSDKSKFKKAGDLLSKDEFEEAAGILDSLETRNDALEKLISDIRKRQKSEAAFNEFKEEFLKMEN